MRKVLLIFFLLLSSTLISQELNNPSVKGGFYICGCFNRTLCR